MLALDPALAQTPPPPRARLHSPQLLHKVRPYLTLTLTLAQPLPSP